MRNSRAILCALVAVLGLAARGAAQQPAAPQAFEHVPLFPTRQNAFDIPFQIEEPVPGAEPVEVQLHVSENRGAAWHLVAKARPDEGRFSYKAAHDGELWFLVRTLNRQGRLLPEKAFEPELRVLVDTDPPLLELVCKRGSAGEIDCSWKTSDLYLKLESLQLSYQGIDAGPNWQSVSVPPSTASGNGEWSGRTTFVPTGAKWPLFVRVEVSDSAGNRAAAQSQVETPAGAGPTSLPIATTPGAGSPLTALPNRNDTPWTAATPTSPALGSTASTTMKPAAIGDAAPPTLPSHFPGRESVPPVNRELIPTPPAATSPYRSTSEPRATTQQPPLGAGPLGNGPLRDEAIGPGQIEALPSPTAGSPPVRRTLEPEINRGPTMPPPLAPADEGPTFTGPSGPGLTEPAGEVAPKLPSPPSGFAAPNGFSSPSGTASTGTTPPGISPRMVNSRRFELEYDVESVGSSGVAKVELWSSRDAGRTWAMLGVDPDAASPYVVQVDEEGVYGFKIVIETASGLRSPSPEPGDLPEVWVGVDVTKPAAKLVSIQQRGLDEGGTLTLRWEANDRLLTDRPITLAFSDKPDGPWTTIAAGLPNSGVYDWPFDARTPERLYVKLEVRDSAGNATSYVTPQPTVIERVKPQGRIRGVRPLGESARLKQPSQIVPR